MRYFWILVALVLLPGLALADAGTEVASAEIAAELYLRLAELAAGNPLMGKIMVVVTMMAMTIGFATLAVELIEKIARYTDTDLDDRAAGILKRCVAWLVVFLKHVARDKDVRDGNPKINS